MNLPVRMDIYDGDVMFDGYGGGLLGKALCYLGARRNHSAGASRIQHVLDTNRYFRNTLCQVPGSALPTYLKGYRSRKTWCTGTSDVATKLKLPYQVLKALLER